MTMMKPLFSRPSVLALCAVSLCTWATLASAKLPAPSPEAAAKAAEAAAKAAWAGKVGGYQLCLSQDRVAAYYRKTTPAAKPAAAGLAACADPGPFAYTPPAAQPAPPPAAATTTTPAAAPKS
ncbi:hypothetical protein [Acidovorax sp.]|uniref:hypothetical protein n=1 Tax=Acidovorax sp. TaxID=1872122 RepID=UPI002602E059|nr:hypothetical protein [Acidovorax sp.]